MGLDMYLTKKTYVKNWEFKSDKYAVSAKKNGKKISHIKPERITWIEEELIYWRKANAIHNWFVRECQDGEDDCREAYVSVDNIKTLLDICERIVKDSKLIPGTITNGYRFVDGEKIPITEKGNIIENPETAKALLPTGSGFFFGSTDYDEWYYKGVKETAEKLRAILDELTDCSDSFSIYYHSSW